MAPPSPQPYVQKLEGSAISIEKATVRTPDDLKYHVFVGDHIEASFRTLRDAQRLFRQLRDESGWQPPNLAGLSPGEKLERERLERDRLDYLDYWGSSHKFRGGGRPRRRQR